VNSEFGKRNSEGGVGRREFAAGLPLRIPISEFRILFASLLYHGRMNLAVACGAAVAAAVLTGALLVGDSMRGSLRRLTLDRLGRIDEVLLADRFFRAKLADELAAAPGFSRCAAAAVPLILLRGSVENADPQTPARANQVNLIGSDGRFWQLGSAATPAVRLPGPREIVLNRPLARQLGVGLGDAVIVHLPKPGAIPAASALGQRRDTILGQRLTVCGIIPAEGLGRFALRPNQQEPRNAYVALAGLQSRLHEPGRVNALAVAGSSVEEVPPPQDHELLQALLRPTLADDGLSLERTARGYLNLTSDRLILAPAVERAIGDYFRGEGNRIQPVLVYLANQIAVGPRSIPYSTVAALDFAAAEPLGPFLDAEGKPLGPLADDQVALNSWAAERLGAKVGDLVRITYFQPDRGEGEFRETSVALRLAAIVSLTGAAADRALVPPLPGVTDRTTMLDWDPPFPFNPRRIGPEDKAYWKRYGPTPKAFVSLATGRRLWSSRFGQATSLRISGEEFGIRNSEFGRNAARFALPNSEFRIPNSFFFQPVKRQGLAAAAGTTPFGVLFLAFSSFLILAAVMLSALLFRLAVERRAAEIGILLALGFSRRAVGRLLSAEGFLVAAAGSALGAAAGVGYAAVLLAGLQTWWLAAIVTPFLHLYVTPRSLAIGYAGGLLAAMLAILATVRRLGRVAPRRLLAGQTGEESLPPLAWRRFPWRRRAIEAALAAAAIAPAVVLSLVPVREDVRAGAFFLAGALALACLLALVAMRLRSGATGKAVSAGRGNLLRMALASAARNPLRSTLSTGLVAAACFLIVAVGAFRVDPSRQAPALESGDGGFALVAQSDQPIHADLNTPAGRRQLGFAPDDELLLARGRIVSLRVVGGDDASCLNLYRPRQPRLLGVPPALVQHDGFAWASVPAGCRNPWQLLSEQNSEVGSRKSEGPRRATAAAPNSEFRIPNSLPLPLILERNTANYALDLWEGLGQRYDITDRRGRQFPLQVAALLADSIFQGDLLVDEETLLAFDPETSGYRFFLIEVPPGEASAAEAAKVQSALERTLGDYGLAAEPAARRLAGFLAVQNTYLSTFQSLGALGLLLGTVGLAVVQLRNVLERRGELALLRAAGFRRSTLAALVFLENLLLLALGLACGGLAAAVAVLPHLLGRGATVPWVSMAGALAMILAAGVLASVAAVRAAVCAPLLEALRQG
jgi:ABC-type lipoprotein release transport system permease subunit